MNEVLLTADGLPLIVKIWNDNDQQIIDFNLNAQIPCVLHWGLRGLGNGWQRPAEEMWPAGTRSADSMSADTPFNVDSSGASRITIKHQTHLKSRGLSFVLYFPETKRWAKDGSKDYFLPLRPAGEAPDLSELTSLIEESEVRTSSWSLMHRFNLCHDLLSQLDSTPQMLPLIYVWLRYSAIRQLEWQRQFNTKPKELSHALNRLTARLAGISRQGATQAFWARQMLSTLGRGGEGQQVRDEILNIMHRHHIKETHGRFMEEWHQKLHNNTTSDDVIICEAYLAFLRSRGDTGVFYSTLNRGGVTRERLRSFERPIKQDPEYYGDRADGLIHDFTNYLSILKSVHSGTDFDGACNAASRLLSADVKRNLSEISGLRHNGEIFSLTEKLTWVREEMARSYPSIKDDAALRDLLFLDLSLESLFRQAVERQEQGALNAGGLTRLLNLALRNAILTIGDDEWRACLKHWAKLGAANDAPGGALHAISVASRLSRAVQDSSSHLYRDLQPNAEALGKAFKVQDWTIPIFSEEVIRGNIVFVLAMLLRRMDASLRAAAGIGGWQVVSAHAARGKVRVVNSLMAIQGQCFSEPTVLITDEVSGNEDIPEGVTAVITSSTVDLVSHSAVRARNGGVLCATCFDAEPYAKLKGADGKWISLEVTPAGGVTHQIIDAAAQDSSVKDGAARNALSLRPRTFTAWALSAAEFNTDSVGGKSNNLNRLRGRTPDWIKFPKSIALPFGVFEKLLEQDCNRLVKSKCSELLRNVDSNFSSVLSKMRASIMELQAVPEMETAVRGKWQQENLPALNWAEAWTAIKRVWASKWNDRAYLSRRALGLAHDQLTMAVLIQEVVEADYAFVIHTANPITSNRDEIFGEIVLGLGETLVGNHPGSAMGFIYSRRDGATKVVSYPGKSFGLYGSGVIFRSDSNGEDLEDFAGAGLYDSVLGREPEKRRLDYSADPLLWDQKFRGEMIDRIAQSGLETEKLFGAPQDIEGAITSSGIYIVQTRPQVGLK